MIVPPVHQPYFVRHARRIRAQRIVFALNVHDALPLLLFLSNGIAKNAALFIFEPFVRGAEFVLDSPRHENGSRHLRMRMRPFFPRQRALILEYTDVLKPRVLLQHANAYPPHPYLALTFFFPHLPLSSFLLR